MNNEFVTPSKTSNIVLSLELLSPCMRGLSIVFNPRMPETVFCRLKLTTHKYLHKTHIFTGIFTLIHYTQTLYTIFLKGAAQIDKDFNDIEFFAKTTNSQLRQPKYIHNWHNGQEHNKYQSICCPTSSKQSLGKSQSPPRKLSLMNSSINRHVIVAQSYGGCANRKVKSKARGQNEQELKLSIFNTLLSENTNVINNHIGKNNQASYGTYTYNMNTIHEQPNTSYVE